jgi:hypothetical protein
VNLLKLNWKPEKDHHFPIYPIKDRAEPSLRSSIHFAIFPWLTERIITILTPQPEFTLIFSTYRLLFHAKFVNSHMICHRDRFNKPGQKNKWVIAWIRKINLGMSNQKSVVVSVLGITCIWLWMNNLRASAETSRKLHQTQERSRSH